MTTWVSRSTGSSVFSNRRNSNIGYVTSWTTATRPSSPFVSQTGTNTDHGGLETWNADTSKWLIRDGRWTTATRPDTTNIDVGSKGFNSDMDQDETWNGTSWIL